MTPDLLDAVAMFSDLAVDTDKAERMTAWSMLNDLEDRRGRSAVLNLLNAWIATCQRRGLRVMAEIFERHRVMYQAAAELGIQA